MTREEKRELIKDISARIPYGLKAQITYFERNELKTDIITIKGIYEDLVLYDDEFGQEDIPVDVVKPYFRRYDSLTEEEQDTFDSLILDSILVGDIIDWCNEHYLDYRCLIAKGLALEMSEEMYQEIVNSNEAI